MRKSSQRLSAKQVKPHGVGGFACGGGAQNDDARDDPAVVDGDVELQVRVNPDAPEQVRAAAERHDRAVGGGVGAGSTATRLAAANAEIALLKAQVAQLKDKPAETCWFYEDETRQGPFTLPQLKEWRDEGHFGNDIEVWRGEDAEDAVVELLEALLAAGLGDDAEWWYDDDDDCDERHGPFAPAQLKTWRDDGHFDDTMLVRRGREGEPVELGTIIE